MALTEADIRDCYRIVLGREPDSAGLAAHLAHIKKNNIRDPYVISRALFASAEFKAKVPDLAPPSIFDHLEKIRYRGIDFLLPREDFSYLSLKNENAYEPYVSQHLFRRIRPGEVFLDIGANLGLFALPVAREIGAKGHVLAVEASPENARLLLNNANRNGIANLTIFPVGAGDANGSVVSPKQSRSSDKVLLPPGNLQRFGMNHDLIPIVRLDDLLSGYERRIDVLKMDVEGYEYRVVKGAGRVLREHKPDIYLEYSDAFQRHGSQVGGAALLGALAELGYSFTVLHRNAPPELVGASGVSDGIKAVDERLARVVANRGTHLDLYLTASER